MIIKLQSLHKKEEPDVIFRMKHLSKYRKKLREILKKEAINTQSAYCPFLSETIKIGH